MSSNPCIQRWETITRQARATCHANRLGLQLRLYTGLVGDDSAAEVAVVAQYKLTFTFMLCVSFRKSAAATTMGAVEPT